MGSSGPSRQETNNMSTGSSESSRQGTNSMYLNINQDKSHHHQAGDKRKHLSDDESYDDDDWLSVIGCDRDKEKCLFEKLKSISPQLHQSFRVLNASFTDIQRKRKRDVCSSLGRHFTQFSQSNSFEQYLLDEPAMKRIRAEM